jgi:hypothetical protein
VAEHLGINDGTTTMRILERVMPLKEEWKAARQAAGLKTRLDPADPDRPKRLVAELHVLIYGLSTLPPGASGAYVLLELGDHAAKSTFVPSSAYEAWYYEGYDGAMFAAGGPNFPTTASSFVHRPTDTYNLWPAEEARNEHGAWPQTFKLTIDDDIAKDKDKKYGKIFVDVVAWFPQVGSARPSRGARTAASSLGRSRLRWALVCASTIHDARVRAPIAHSGVHVWVRAPIAHSGVHVWVCVCSLRACRRRPRVAAARVWRVPVRAAGRRALSRLPHRRSARQEDQIAPHAL